MRILGVDPGLRHTGWGVVSLVQGKLSYVASGRISPNSSLSMAERLYVLHQALSDILTSYVPNTAGVEETFVNDNAMTSLKLGHARGTILLTLGMEKIPVGEYAPRLVKKSVVGVGNASKEQVEMMVQQLLPAAKLESADEADALAIAVCHSAYMKMPA